MTALMTTLDPLTVTYLLGTRERKAFAIVLIIESMVPLIQVEIIEQDLKLFDF